MCSWIGDPTRLRSIKDGVCPSLDAERESIRIDIGSGRFATPALALVEMDVVQKDDNLGRGNKLTLRN
jgi:hypothetical protein